jgi:hypothetical protein
VNRRRYIRKDKQSDTLVQEWRDFVSLINTKVSNQEEILKKFRSSAWELGPPLDPSSVVVTWGDSVYSRIYGQADLELKSSKFDRLDFMAILQAYHVCQTVDQKFAKELYAKATDDRETSESFRDHSIKSFFENRSHVIDEVTWPGS